MASWGSFLASAAGPLAKKVLTSVGVGVISYTAAKAVIDQVSTSITDSMSGIGGDVYQLLALAGFVDAVSIAIAAVTAAAALAFGKRLGMLSK